MPESSHESGGALEAGRRRAFLVAANDANARAMAAAVTELAEIADRMEATLKRAESKERT